MIYYIIQLVNLLPTLQKHICLHFNLICIMLLAFCATGRLAILGIIVINLARRTSKFARFAAKSNLEFCLLVSKKFKVRYKI